jgi:hypothetical protein
MSFPRNTRCGPSPRRTSRRADRTATILPGAKAGAERGSAVITVLVLAAVTAVIASGFLFRSAQEAKLATRGFFQNAALNLAEAGVEEGLYASSTSGFTSANGWSLASGSTTDYVKSITSGFNFQQATGAIYIRVDGATSLTPAVTAAGVIAIPNQRSIVKQIRVGGTARRLWSSGIVAKGVLTFSGNAAIDSYDSSVGPYNSGTNRTDQAIVASASTALDTVVLSSNASIYGYVATTGDDPVVGSGGMIYGATTPSGTKVDTSRIRHDFTANLPDVSAPTGAAVSLSAISASLTLPRTGDTAGSNGRYLYTTSSISLSSSRILSIMGPVDLIVTGSISLTGNSELSVGGSGSTNPSLNVYCPGNISLGGNGMANETNLPAKVTIWGTAASPATQTVSITGNGEYIGTIYAPNAALTLGGSGSTSGAVVASSVTVSGNGQYHYDTRLASVQTPLDSSFRINAWAELTGAPGGGGAFARDNREPFASLF